MKSWTGEPPDEEYYEDVGEQRAVGDDVERRLNQAGRAAELLLDRIRGLPAGVVENLGFELLTGGSA